MGLKVIVSLVPGGVNTGHKSQTLHGQNSYHLKSPPPGPFIPKRVEGRESLDHYCFQLTRPTSIEL